MKKNNFKDNLKEIHKIASLMPKTLNEAIHFENDDMLDKPEFEDEPEESILDREDIAPEEKPMENDPLVDIDKGPGRELVDKIRKISLNGLASLAETPELPEYEVLKKIWQLCDKSLAERKEKEGDEK